ncbi:MAG: phospholipase D-like domain-containing protein [Parcubacteria group bacterium]
MFDTSWQFYLTGEQAWEAMLLACGRAEKSIDVEQFIFAYDSIGRRFHELFIAKTRAGVRVRLIIDGGGSYGFYNSKPHRELVQAGVEVKFFSTISPWRLNNISSFFFRNHRKLLIIDDVVGFTGGVGVEERMRVWRDTHLSISGPVVAEFSQAFALMWRTISSGNYKRFRRKWKAVGEFALLINSPRFRQRHVYYEYMRRLRRAKRYIYLTSPYFVPSQRLFFWLMRKARRGLDVRLLLPEQSDYDMVDVAGRSYYQPLLNAGVRVYQYPCGLKRERMLHVKSAVVDDSWATIGSSNLDSLSFVYNYEANLVSTNPGFAGEVRAQFMHDLKSAKEIMPADWPRRSALQKFYELLTWPFHWLL